MRWRNFISPTLVLAAAAFVGVAIPAHPPALAAAPNECGARPARTAVTRFLSAFNSGDLTQLDRLIASSGAFGGYVVNGVPGGRVGKAARTRSTLIAYFSQRHRHGEQLLLTRFGFSGRSLGEARFWFELVRSADDLVPPELYPGKGVLSCAGLRRLVVWEMGPNSEPRLPAPQSYAETCRLVSSWCELEQSAGGIPDALRRPLALPSVEPGGVCPATGGHPFDNGQFAGTVLGDGPVQPLIPGSQAARGILTFHPYAYVERRGWYSLKTLWFSDPSYRGPLLIRGRQLDGPHEIVLGEAPALVDPQLGPGATLNGMNGWREWPGGTWLRTPGCYAWQIDGTTFSHVIVFNAVFLPQR